MVWSDHDQEAPALRIVTVNGTTTEIELPETESCSVVDVAEAAGEGIWVSVFLCEDDELKVFLLQEDETITLRAVAKAHAKLNAGDIVSRTANDGTLIAQWQHRSGNRSPLAGSYSVVTVPTHSGTVLSSHEVKVSFEMQSYLSFADGKSFLLTAYDNPGVWQFATNGKQPPKHFFASTDFPNTSLEGNATVVGRTIVLLDSDSHAYRVIQDGSTADKGQSAFPATRFFRSDSAEDGKHVWLTAQESVLLWDLSAESTVLSSSFTRRKDDRVPRIPYRAAEQRLRVVPVGEGRAWFINQAFLGVDIYDLPQNTWLKASPILLDAAIGEISRLKNGGLAVEDRINKQLYFASSDGTLLHGGQPQPVEYRRAYRAEEFPVPDSPTQQCIIALPQSDKSVRLVDNEGRSVTHLTDTMLGGETLWKLYPTADAKRFWISTSGPPYFLDIQGGDLSIIAVMPKTSRYQQVESTGANSAWIFSDGNVSYVTVSGKPLSARVSEWERHHKVNEYRSFWPTSSPMRAWVRDVRTSTCYLIGADTTATGLRIFLGGLLLDPANQRSSDTIAVDRREGIVIHFGDVLPFRPEDAKAVWSVAFDDTKGGRISTGTHEVSPSSTEVRFDWPSELSVPNEVSISVLFEDRFGTQLRADWPQVRLVARSHFWETAQWRAVMAWFVVAMLLVLSQRQTWSTLLQRYAPLTLGLFSLTSAPTVGSRLDIDLLWFWGLVVLSVTVLMVMGAFRPIILRRLASMAPLDITVPFLLRVPTMRRRYFASYVNDLERLLLAERHAAKEESYVPIPVDVHWPKKAFVQDSPDRALATELLHSHDRTPAPNSRPLEEFGFRSTANVLIQSPGGQGKTALLRRLVEIAIARFRETGRTPIPLRCTEVKDDLHLSARNALGTKYIIDAAFNEQLQSGVFVLVVDGLSEHAPSPTVVETFVRSGYKTRVLATSRPHAGYEAAFMATSNSLIVEPRRLDERTIEWFEDKYLGLGQRLPPQTRAACAGSDGTYLPILVRLAATATKANREHLNTVADIFEAAFDTLLKEEGQREAAAKLCMETYWNTGLRTIAARIQRHQHSLDQLRKAGLLVPVQLAANTASGEPQELRFFHDSMQSFLTAEGLFNLPDDKGWEYLIEAAGDKRFTQGGSELFQTCVQVFKPRRLLRQRLRSELLTWAKENHQLFSAQQIAFAAKGVYDLSLSSSVTIKALLEEAVSVCDAEQIEDSLAIFNLAQIYSYLAPTVWAGESRPTRNPLAGPALPLRA